jgi:hypothetical protein
MMGGAINQAARDDGTGLGGRLCTRRRRCRHQRMRGHRQQDCAKEECDARRIAFDASDRCMGFEVHTDKTTTRSLTLAEIG